MSENRPSPNMHTDSKKTYKFSKLKNYPLKSKKSFKSLNVRKLTPPNMPILNTKNHWEVGKATSPLQELQGGPRSGPNF